MSITRRQWPRRGHAQAAHCLLLVVAALCAHADAIQSPFSIHKYKNFLSLLLLQHKAQSAHFQIHNRSLSRPKGVFLRHTQTK
jgi:hypothetical protein